uniref:tRNA-guanine(15) transglycosylase-like domain-containing protein n=1 Tax=Araucaria cunninghamii TaxID=56994 RepID=A0A0D6R690_ARACU
MTTTRFVVKACNSGNGGSAGSRATARTATLYLGCSSGASEMATEIEMESPCLLLASRKGLPHFTSPDLLHWLHPHSRLLQFTPFHFWECPSPSTVAALGGIHEMLSMPEYGFIAIPRDSVTCISDAEGGNKFGASFETPSGRRMVKPAQYMESISALKPNLWSSLPDEVPAWVSNKRNKISVDRTTRWLDECLAMKPMNAETALGPIVGGTTLEERIRSAQEVASRNVSGFWLAGFGLGESMEQRAALLDAVMGILPEDKPRGISGLGLPEMIPHQSWKSASVILVRDIQRLISIIC